MSMTRCLQKVGRSAMSELQRFRTSSRLLVTAAIGRLLRRVYTWEPTITPRRDVRRTDVAFLPHYAVVHAVGHGYC
jgi:hypothetical protein